MLNEVLENKEYLGYLEAGLPRSGKGKGKGKGKGNGKGKGKETDAEASKSIVRILRILARHYWFETPEGETDYERVKVVSEKLSSFYQTAFIDKAPSGLDPKDLKKRVGALERYNKPDFEFSSRSYTFYSIIADAVDHGPLNGRCEETLLRKGELMYLLKLAGEAKKPIKDPIVCRLAALIVYFRRYAGIYGVKDGCIPVSNRQLNHWLGSKYLENSSGGQKIWASHYGFIELRSRYGSVDGSSFLRVDMDELNTKVSEMISGLRLSGEDAAALESEGWTFSDNNLSDAIDARIKELKKKSAR